MLLVNIPFPRFKSRFGRQGCLVFLTAVAAGAGVFLSVLSAEATGLSGVEAIEEELVYQAGPGPVALLLSKSRYPAEDEHIDGIVWLRGAEAPPEGRLEVAIGGGQGNVLLAETISPIPGERVFFSAPFPRELAGQSAELSARWFGPGDTLRGQANETFSVAPAESVARSGSIPLRVANEDGTRLAGAPMTVGVPFPRGALHEGAQVRLLDETGRVIPVQTRVMNRWSRFGSIRWLQCDFTAELDGGPREFVLQYGEELASPPEAPAIEIEAVGEDFPVIDAGRLRVSGEGVFFDPSGEGEFVRVLDPHALRGAFVEHEDGRIFVIPEEGGYEIEEAGAEKVVVLKRGWYVEPESGERFCQYHTRFILHRDSALLRIFHTWIFTGDAREDRIANMGWRFGTDAALSPAGFLDSFSGEGAWLPGDSLLQYDYNRFEVAGAAGLHEGERAPGVFASAGGGVRLHIGTKDFWQNFPHELEFGESAMYFHMWPRNARPAENPTTLENMNRLWFAHEGEMLNFAVPETYADEAFMEVWGTRGEFIPRETINAQGVAKTTELWLYVSPEEEPLGESDGVLGALNDETLRAYPDPAWVASSGAFYEIHPYDPETYPEEERVYEQHALAPMRWAERTEIYGKWIWGDVVWDPQLRERGWGHPYRGYRKAHQGWPYSWIPYARSGDSRYLKFAEAATRKQADVNFVHYSDERTGRPRGQWIRSYIPWAHTRGRPPQTRAYTNKCNYLWHAYYLTGYHRARDVVLDWGELTKADQDDGILTQPTRIGTGRPRMTLLHSYTEMYEATFDPWFLAAAHEIARTHLLGDWLGHMWNPGIRDFQRFSGSEEYRDFYLDRYARFWATTRAPGWHYVRNYTMIEPSAYAYHLTGDTFYLRRAAHWVDWASAATYDGEPDYYDGFRIQAAGKGAGPLFTGYYLQVFPLALAAFEKAGGKPDPIPSAFSQAPATLRRNAAGDFQYEMPAVFIKKEAGQAVPLDPRVNYRGQEEIRFHYEVTGPDGTVVLEDTWDIRQLEYNYEPRTELPEIPAEAPAGIYRLRVSGESPHRNHGLFVPLSPPDNPEVMVFPKGGNVGSSQWENQYWFRVPEEVTEFWVEFVHAPGRPGRLNLIRPSIWDPDGNVAWREQFDKLDGDRPTGLLRAEVEVAPEHAGGLFRITLPHVHGGFLLDPAIPPIFSVTPQRWFPVEF